MGVQEQSPTLQSRPYRSTSRDIALLDGETVIESAHPSLWNWWRVILIGIGAKLLVIPAVATGQLTAAVIISGFAVVSGAYAYFAQQRSWYVVTTQRVVTSVGLLQSESEDIRIADIRGVTTKRGIRHRLMRTGTVETRSIGGDPLTMRNFKAYESFAGAIRAQQQTVENTISPGTPSVSTGDNDFE